MQKFRVIEVKRIHEWSNAHGQNYDYNLIVEGPEGKGEIQVTAKSKTAYSPGNEFWAVSKGQEFKGIPKYKRVQAPDNNNSPPTQQPRQQSGTWGSRPDAPQSPQKPRGAVSSPPPAPMPQSRPPMPYEDAIALFAHMTEKLNQPSQWNGIGTQLLMAIVLGKIENPAAKPKTVVVHFGNEIETAGIEQDAFDEVMALSDTLAELTDQKKVRALLIATAGVQTRKDLDAEKAKLFIEALKLNILAAKRAAPPPPEDEDPPF